MAADDRKVLRDEHVEPRANARRRRRGSHGRLFGGRVGRRRRQRFRHRECRPEECGGGGRRHANAQVANGRAASAIGMHAVRENDHVGAARGVDPHGRSREAGVPDRARGEEGRRDRGVSRRHVPTERPRTAPFLRARPHQVHGLRLQDAMAIESPAVEEHAADARDVHGRGEDPRVARNAAERPGAWVVNLPEQEVPVVKLGRCDSPTLHGRRMERRVFEMKRPGDYRG